MKITKITATASRKFNHPYESYANFGFAITLEAETSADFVETCGELDFLRSMAEQTAEKHKREILQEVQNGRLRDSLKQQIAECEATPETIQKLEHCIALELAKPSEVQDAWDLKSWRKNLEYCQTWPERLEQAKAKLSALPSPQLLVLPEIHPGHPDHPATDTDTDY